MKEADCAVKNHCEKSKKTRPNSLIDAIASNNDYGWNDALFKPT